MTSKSVEKIKIKAKVPGFYSQSNSRTEKFILVE
jgi:hypothetical protein